MQIKVQTPAKINLVLEVVGKRPDGFHNLHTVMHAISLSDFLTIKVEESYSLENEIELSGTSFEIPYDERNIVYKAVKLYLEKTQITNKKVSVHIEKNIPVAAGLAGGSTNAAGAFWGINELFENKLTRAQLHELAAVLGSDLNFCLEGGCAFCTSRGEVIENLPSADFKLSLLKPKSFGISAKEAYQKFALLEDKSYPNNAVKMREGLLKGEFLPELLYNSLERPILPDYPVLQEIKTKVENSMMSGSGPTFFVLNKAFGSEWKSDEFLVFNDLTSVPFGVRAV